MTSPHASLHWQARITVLAPERKKWKILKISVGSIKLAWHKARSRKVKKIPLREDKADPTKITGHKNKIEMNSGPSLKGWAYLQLQQKTQYAEACRIWLSNKAGKNQTELSSEKRALNQEICSATRSSRRSKSSKKAD